MTAALPLLLCHHRWTSMTLVRAIAALSTEVLGPTSPGVHGAVHQTLAHMVEGEERYLAAGMP